MTVTPWSCTSRAWGSCCCSWPVSWDSGRAFRARMGPAPIPHALTRFPCSGAGGAAEGAAPRGGECQPWDTAVPSGLTPRDCVLSLFPHQIQTLMARAEYLKDQIKVRCLGWALEGAGGG